MKINNETKVGILFIAAIAIFIVGFNYLKGNDVFSKKRKLYMVFDKLDGLMKSNEVRVNGYVIGTIYSIEPVDQQLNGILATVNLKEDIQLPEDSKAYINSSPIGVGASYVVIEKGTSSNFLSSGDTLHTTQVAGMLDALKDQLNPTLGKLNNGLDSITLLVSNLNQTISEQMRRDLQGTISNLHASTASLTTLLNDNKSPLVASLNNVNAITGNLAKNNDSISAIISNAKIASEKLANLDIQTTINKFDESLTELKSIVAKMNSTDGTLGALINDKQLYDRLHNTILSAEILMDDLKAHPKRYVSFSLFGKKDKGNALSSPAVKDTTPVVPK